MRPVSSWILAPNGDVLDDHRDEEVEDCEVREEDEQDEEHDEPEVLLHEWLRDVGPALERDNGEKGVPPRDSDS